MKRSLILLKEQFYLSPGKEGNGFFSRGGVVTWFSGGMKWGREDLSSPTEYKGDYSLHLSPGRGGTEDFWGVTWFSGVLKEGPVVSNRV